QNRVSRPLSTAVAVRGTVDFAPEESVGSTQRPSTDVVWDEIVEITSLGEQSVYDATVDETHNFVADGIVMHNSIAQAADMAILIHRPDAFERDDPRMG